MDGEGAESSEALAERLLALGSPATEHLGTRLLSVDVEGGAARFAFTARPEFANMLGGVQGGFVAAMLDETAGLTARLVSPPGLVVPTLDLHVSFIRPVAPGPLWSVGRCVRVGRRVAVMEADLLDAEGRLLSRLHATALAERGEKP